MKIKTFSTTPSNITRNWWIVDAEGETLGRLASRITPYLTGKNKPIYTPQLDTGDYVIVINCEKIRVTGNRLDEKMYYRHSGYPSGLSSLTMRQMLDKHPERVITFAIRGMLPGSALGRNMLKKLKVYTGSEHPHAAQKPVVLEF